MASFSSFSLQLIAVGAPPQLIEAAHRSAIEEIEHARLSFMLASAYAGKPVSPGTFNSHSLTIHPDVQSLALSTIREACISETLATLSAAYRYAKSLKFNHIVKNIQLSATQLKQI